MFERAETKETIETKKRAIDRFVGLFSGSYQKLSQNDVDYKVFDQKQELIAYVEIRIRTKPMRAAFPLPVPARKAVKLCDKRIAPIVIWSCEDGIYYGDLRKMYGTVRYGGKKPRPHNSNNEEVMLYYDKQDALKYLRF